MAKAKSVIKVVDLKKVVAETNALYAEAQTEVLVLVQRFIRIGELLTTAKREVGTGKWLQFVEVNYPFGDRQARKYMSTYANRELVLDHKDAVDGSLNKSVKLIADMSGLDEAAVDSVEEARRVQNVENNLKQAEEAIKKFKEEQKKLVAQLDELRTDASGDEEAVSAEIERLKKKRAVLLADIQGLNIVERTLSRGRDFFTKQLSIIPALSITARVTKATKADAAKLAELARNWATAIEEKWDV